MSSQSSDTRTGDVTLLVVNKHEDTMSYVNPITFEPLAKVPTGPDPHEIVITPDRRFAYLSNYAPPGDTVSVMDLVNRKHLMQISTGNFTRIHGAAMAPDGKHAYFTAGQTGYVVEVDTATNQVTRGIPTHGEISHMVVVSPDGRRIYTANMETRDVSVLDRETGDLIAKIPCDKGCEGPAFTPDGKRLWVANEHAGNITIIDLATHTAVETVPCPGEPVRIKFTADAKLALVTSWEKPGDLVILDVDARREIKRLRLGDWPLGLEISPDGGRAFVTNMASDEIHVIDMATLEIAHVFTTGKGVDGLAWWYAP